MEERGRPMMHFIRIMALAFWVVMMVVGLGGTSGPSITVTPETVTVPEGGTATFQVRLNAQPASLVTVTVRRVSGDADIRVESGSSLTFTALDWDAYQTVTLRALKDEDTTIASASIRLSASGVPDKDVIATESNNRVTSVQAPRPPQNLRIISR